MYNIIGTLPNFSQTFPISGENREKKREKSGEKWEKGGEKVGEKWETGKKFFFSLGALSQDIHGPAPNGVRGHVPAKK